MCELDVASAQGCDIIYGRPLCLCFEMDIQKESKQKKQTQNRQRLEMGKKSFSQFLTFLFEKYEKTNSDLESFATFSKDFTRIIRYANIHTHAPQCFLAI